MSTADGLPRPVYDGVGAVTAAIHNHSQKPNYPATHPAFPMQPGSITHAGFLARMSRRIPSHVRLARCGRRKTIERAVGIGDKHIDLVRTARPVLRSRFAQECQQVLVQFLPRPRESRRDHRQRVPLQRPPRRTRHSQTQYFCTRTPRPTRAACRLRSPRNRAWFISAIDFFQAFIESATFGHHLPRERFLSVSQNIFAAHLNRRNIERVREFIHLAFHRKRRLRDAESAKRARRHIVRVHRVRVDLAFATVIRSRRVRCDRSIT